MLELEHLTVRQKAAIFGEQESGALEALVLRRVTKSVSKNKV